MMRRFISVASNHFYDDENNNNVILLPPSTSTTQVHINDIDITNTIKPATSFQG